MSNAEFDSKGARFQSELVNSITLLKKCALGEKSNNVFPFFLEIFAPIPTSVIDMFQYSNSSSFNEKQVFDQHT